MNNIELSLKREEAIKKYVKKQIYNVKMIL